MRADVYRNLNKGCFSVRDRKTGKVVAHEDEVFVENATLVVQPAGNRRVRATRTKSVHAFVRGEVHDPWPVLLVEGWTEATYDPYRHTSFVIKDTGQPVSQARFAHLKDGRLFLASTGPVKEDEEIRPT